MDEKFDVCVIGSGAGGAPVAKSLAEAGYRVVVLEKGGWYTEDDFFKDELACCRRQVFKPPVSEQQHVLETRNRDGQWIARAGRSFWNGNCVGGSSNFMSGFFFRLKPEDFRLASEFGPIEGANVVDWPISYDDLEPYYARVETEVGISGRVVEHPNAEPRSTRAFPQPPTMEHPFAGEIDAVCIGKGLHPLPTPRAILSRPSGQRGVCEYSGYCGSYGCSSGAKGSARAALLDRALDSGCLEIRPGMQAKRIISDQQGRAVAVECGDRNGRTRWIEAALFVVACQAVESARLLLNSRGAQHPDGLGNNHGQVGRNLIFSSGGAGTAEFDVGGMSAGRAAALRTRGPFVNRSLQDWYFMYDLPNRMGTRRKGGTIDFLMRHPNPILRAQSSKWAGSKLRWGSDLKRRLKRSFTTRQYLRFEVFCDWLPNDDCRVSLDSEIRDRWDMPVARIRTGQHPHDRQVGAFLVSKARRIAELMGADRVRSGVRRNASRNLMAGGCRFGTDPVHSVLDPDCRIHGVDNVYVTDGSFMPTGGSVPFTWTIYANAFRVADRILERMHKITG